MCVCLCDLCDTDFCREHWCPCTTHMSMYYTHVHVLHTCPCTTHMSLYYTHVPVLHTCPCTTHMSMYCTHVPVLHTCPCTTHMSMYYTHVHVLHTCTCTTHVSMYYTLVHVLHTCPSTTHMSLYYTHVHALHTCPCTTHMSMYYTHVHVLHTCPCTTHVLHTCPCTTHMSMHYTHVHVLHTCPCTTHMSMYYTRVHVLHTCPCTTHMSMYYTHVCTHRCLHMLRLFCVVTKKNSSVPIMMHAHTHFHCRVSFRDDHNGITLLLHLTDAILFNVPFPSPNNTAEPSQAAPTSSLAQDQSPSVQSSAGGTVPPPLSWETAWNLPCPITEDACALLCEILKVFFNQTLHWKKDGSYTEVRANMGAVGEKGVW